VIIVGSKLGRKIEPWSQKIAGTPSVLPGLMRSSEDPEVSVRSSNPRSINTQTTWQGVQFLALLATEVRLGDPTCNSLQPRPRLPVDPTPGMEL